MQMRMRPGSLRAGRFGGCIGHRCRVRVLQHALNALEQCLLILGLPDCVSPFFLTRVLLRPQPWRQSGPPGPASGPPSFPRAWPR
eukprot:3567373-Pyramimonas_sp.AAC.1